MTMRNRLYLRRALLGAGAALIATAGIAQTALAADKLVVGALRFTSHSAGFVALEKGYFKQEGLDVEFRFFQAAAPTAVAVAAGDADFAIAGITGGFINLAGKGAIRAVGGVLHERKGVDGMALLASKKAYEAGLTKPAHLKGKSLALTQFGSTFHYMGAVTAEKFGFSIKDIRVRPLQKVGAMIGALKSGQVDAMFMVPHIAKPLARGGAAKIVGWLRDWHPDYQITALITSTRNIEKRRGLVEKFLRAYAKGMADFNRVMLDQKKDPAAVEAMVKTIHKYVYTSRPYAKAARSIKAGAMFLNPGLSLDLKSIKHQLEWNQSQGFVKKDITMDQVVDTSFVKTN
ncbi:MAG: ABC transporter substrate-binding protein [Rhodospirillaceae bacterium]|nr:ABC transporter substrate-binding protein [Rhodospirillaceae bacterium]MDE0255708.1 ABC transporter substrate-binding protein [Rhodospirillaceae bacterium]MDE0617903.1 ABC transporter substrate-binding protein [Rhodospirillaceae bacterium]